MRQAHPILIRFLALWYVRPTRRSPSPSFSSSLAAVPGPVRMLLQIRVYVPAAAKRQNRTGISKNRYYSPGQGRFVSRDPIGYRDGMGLYVGYFASRLSTDTLGLKSAPPPKGVPPVYPDPGDVKLFVSTEKDGYMCDKEEYKE